QCTLCGPEFAKTTNCARWAPAQPNCTLLGATCSQPESEMGLAAGRDVALGRGVALGPKVAVGLLSAALGAHEPLHLPSPTTPTWLSSRRPSRLMSNTTLAPRLIPSSRVLIDPLGGPTGSSARGGRSPRGGQVGASPKAPGSVATAGAYRSRFGTVGSS